MVETRFLWDLRLRNLRTARETAAPGVQKSVAAGWPSGVVWLKDGLRMGNHRPNSCENLFFSWFWAEKQRCAEIFVPKFMEKYLDSGKRRPINMKQHDISRNIWHPFDLTTAAAADSWSENWACGWCSIRCKHREKLMHQVSLNFYNIHICFLEYTMLIHIFIFLWNIMGM